MEGLRTPRLAALAAVLVVLPGVPGPGDDEEVPKRQPALAWEREVPCDSAADLVAGTDSVPRRCEIAVTGDALYLLEHTAGRAADGRFHLTRFDIATGEDRWSQMVGPVATIDADDHTVVLSDKSRFEVYDADSGQLRFERDGEVADVNRYGVLLLADGSAVTALDSASGEELWSAEGALGAVCRDIVIVVAAKSEGEARPFVVVDHRTGEQRWSSEAPFDTREHEITCGFGPYVYTTDGDELHEWDANSGWLNWSAGIEEAGAIEIYREVVLVRSGSASDTVVAVERETGQVRWERPADEVGAPVSIVGRVREDATGVFTLHPLSGEIVNHTAFSPDSSFDVVASSDTRLVVATGSRVTAYGMNDLGTSWELDVGGSPEEFGVAAGHLVVRTGAVLRGYR